MDRRGSLRRSVLLKNPEVMPQSLPMLFRAILNSTDLERNHWRLMLLTRLRQTFSADEFNAKTLVGAVGTPYRYMIIT